jgi:hypothetical protein
LPDYIDWNYEQIYKIITNELGWIAHTPEAEHADCEVDNVVHYTRQRKYPALIAEMLRLSKRVTCGQLDRKEANKRVAEKKSSIKEPSNLNFFLNALNITKEEMDGILSDPTKHMKYTKENSTIVRRLRTLKKRVLSL